MICPVSYIRLFVQSSDTVDTSPTQPSSPLLRPFDQSSCNVVDPPSNSLRLLTGTVTLTFLPDSYVICESSVVIVLSFTTKGSPKEEERERDPLIKESQVTVVIDSEVRVVERMLGLTFRLIEGNLQGTCGT